MLTSFDCAHLNGMCLVQIPKRKYNYVHNNIIVTYKVTILYCLLAIKQPEPKLQCNRLFLDCLIFVQFLMHRL